MKKVIGIILTGLLSIFSLTGCGDDGKFEGTFQNKKDQYGKSFYERAILTKQDNGYLLEKNLVYHLLLYLNFLILKL